MVGAVKIIGSVIARNEADRYLEPCLRALLEWVDEIRLLDDSSTDATQDMLATIHDPRIVVHHHEVENRNQHTDFHLHAAARTRLLHFTLGGDPTYIAAVDADEFVTDGAAVRHACERDPDAVAVNIAEVWQACGDRLCIRQDGGWRSHPIAAVWRVQRFRGQVLKLTDKQTATGRVPDAVHKVKAVPSGAAQLHFGWTNQAERAERFKRYPPGSGHNDQHVQSILWPDNRVTLEAWEWPASWSNGLREAVLGRANRA